MLILLGEGPETAGMFSPKDFELSRIMMNIVTLVGEGSREAA
jgi:hypothetical protein